MVNKIPSSKGLYFFILSFYDGFSAYSGYSFSVVCQMQANMSMHLTRPHRFTSPMGTLLFQLSAAR